MIKTLTQRIAHLLSHSAKVPGRRKVFRSPFSLVQTPLVDSTSDSTMGFTLRSVKRKELKSQSD
jgi:hypothetical protein